MENHLTPASLSQIMQIMQDHFLQATGDEVKAAEKINGVAEMVKEPGNKLVHFDDVLFMVSVFDKNMVEIHAMIGGNPTVEEKIKKLDAVFPKFFKVLKLIDVKIAYTYMDKVASQQYKRLLDKHNFVGQELTGPNGEDLIAFYVEI